MSKFIGEMTFEEFKDALRIILSKEGDINCEEKDERTFSEKAHDGIKQTVKDIKYLFSVEFLEDIKKDFLKFLKVLKDIITFKFLNDKIAPAQKEPLTKDVFIREGKKFKAALADIVETVVFVVVMVVIIRFFVGEIRWIPSGSMKPTLLEGDRIVVERYSRFYSTPKRGDIMVFYPPFEELKNTPGKLFARLTGFFCKDVAYIKRVVGMPGDKYEIKSDEYGKYTVYINDKPLSEPYIKSPYDYTPCTEAMFCGPAVLPPKHYLMLGDNRGNSQDGRYWGLLPEDRFIGRAVFLFWPFDRIKSLTKY